jgi:hypothetical protein
MFNGDRLAFVKGYKRKNGGRKPESVSAIPQSINEEMDTLDRDGDEVSCENLCK